MIYTLHKFVFLTLLCTVLAPRLTGDYSGSDGVNDNSVSIPAELLPIADVCQFLHKDRRKRHLQIDSNRRSIFNIVIGYLINFPTSF
ncbi:hypothetical protein P9112_010308 [Eukaryota sp. TZLM1-RC]